ncbi:Wzz/FepE/Etk N-terminal domain-containing protein [Microbacterium sp. CFBP9034]|uniref:Wzz/FepE/Etk N-terminal domain-containing protein n=1 Tax=Microbacterium sp. CFBP9034 TaxID=3096540 RepID=UPI002A6AECA7|nr:Wzz/FepE/Etk N-terminal domain-containing protein [Microbacterium sp. CFBP9034]MDY0910378.1 Wzz/FepE/Etk N-terminal domain-containing protein [Microbacterium sp. CFBP9034]
MDLTRFYRMLKKSWLVLAGLALVGGAIGAVAAYATPASYTATARLFVSFESPATATSGDLVQANNFAIQKVFSYVEVVDSPAVLGRVVEDLGLAVTPAQLAMSVSATVPINSVVIELSASAANPADATELVTATADSFTDYVVNTLESPAGGGPGPVKIVVLQPAVDPLAPSSPNLITNVAVGIFVGLFVALLIVLLLTLRDKRLHSRADVERLGLGYLGGVPEFGRGADADHLALRDAPDSPEAEAVRRLRTRLALTADSGRTVIGVVSTIGGEGASTLAANLAASFVESGSCVAVLDADVQYGRQRDLLGIPTRTRDEALVDAGESKIVLVDALADARSGDLDQEDFALSVSALAQAFDVVIVDSPPVLRSVDSLIAVVAVDRCLLAVASGRVDTAEVASAVETLRGIGASLEGAVLTRVPRAGMDADPAVAVTPHARTLT